MERKLNGQTIKVMKIYNKLPYNIKSASLLLCCFYAICVFAVHSCKSYSTIELLTDNDTKFWKSKGRDFPQFISFCRLDYRCLEYDHEFQKVYRGNSGKFSRGHFFQLKGDKIIRRYEYWDGQPEIADTLEIVSISREKMILKNMYFGKEFVNKYERCEKKDDLREKSVNKMELYSHDFDYRLFQGTPAWGLAKAVMDCNTKEIIQQVKKLGVYVNYKDPTYGKTLLMCAVCDNNPGTVQTLLALGADPNIYEDSLTTAGENAVTLASKKEFASAKILGLLLKHGGNPNSASCGLTASRHNSALHNASHCSLERVKLLIEAGADVNMIIQEEDAVVNAIMENKMDILLYLLEHGADYNRKYVVNRKLGCEQKDILFFLRRCTFNLDSEKYQYKLKVISFLQDHGLNYWETPRDDEYIRKKIKTSGVYKPYDIDMYLERY